jgi:hypothetical protein
MFTIKTHVYLHLLYRALWCLCNKDILPSLQEVFIFLTKSFFVGGGGGDQEDKQDYF